MLRLRAGGVRDVLVPWASGDTVREVLAHLLRLRPELAGHVLSEDGRLLEYVSVFLDGRDIRDLAGLDTRMGDQTEISIFPPVAGGR